MPIRCIEIELIKHWQKEMDVMNFSFPFSPLYGSLLSSFYFFFKVYTP